MSKEKQIEEMERELREYGRTYDNDVMYGCDDLSEYLVVNKGYAKASEVAREIFEEIQKIFVHNILHNESYSFEGVIDCITKDLDELKKKYTEKSCTICKHMVSCEPNPFGYCEQYEENNGT